MPAAAGAEAASEVEIPAVEARRPALASFTAASIVRWASRQNMRRMSHHRLRRLGGLSLVQWRLHLGQRHEFLHDAQCAVHRKRTSRRKVRPLRQVGSTLQRR